MEGLYKAYIETGDPSCLPRTATFNQLLLVYGRARCSRETRHAILSAVEVPLHCMTTQNPGATFPVRLTRALRVLEDMKAVDDPGLRPDIGTYNQIIRAYGIAGETAEAEELVDKLLAGAVGKGLGGRTWLRNRGQLLAFDGEPANLAGRGEEESATERARTTATVVRPNPQTWAEAIDVYNTMLTSMGAKRRLGDAKRKINMVNQIRA